MYVEGFEQEGILEAGSAAAVSGTTQTDAEDFGALDTLMAGAKTRRAGRGEGGQG